jgi:hypothetical protein
VEQHFLIALLLNFAVLGVLCSLALLATEYYWGSRRTSVVAIVLATLLLVAGAGCHVAALDWTVSVALVAIAAMCLAGSLLRSQRLRYWASQASQPVMVWCLALLASVAAALLVICGANPPGDVSDLPTQAAAGFHLLPSVVAITDTGRELPLCAYDDAETLAEEERTTLNAEHYHHSIIKIAEPSTRCNCHGWVYFGGRYAVRSRDVGTILSDNRYQVVEQPAVGDLAIYKSGEEITHTALVRVVREDGMVICESKWGPLGVYLHPVDVQPYGTDRQYYRSDRGSHQVTVLPTTSRPLDNAPLALATEKLDAASSSSAPLLSATRGKPASRPIYERPTLRIPGQRRT